MTFWIETKFSGIMSWHISMNYFFKNVTFAVWPVALTSGCNTSISINICPKRHWQMQKICFSWKFRWAAYRQQLQQGKKFITICSILRDALLLDDKSEQDPLRALDPISVICFYSWSTWTHGGSVHIKHHSTTSNYSHTNHISAAPFEMQIQTWVTSWVVCSGDEKVLQLWLEILYYH